jgi:signal transduction histidine kinase
MAGYEYLVGVIAELSAAHDHPTIMTIVRRAARELTGADGSTFILRDGDTCLYADEDAVNPLWMGQRLPMAKCLSGWAMLHRQPAVVRDVRLDARVHAADYEGTFVRAIVIVPIQAMNPIGAIGTYWAEPREPYPQEVRLLQALADSAGVAMNNARGHQELESRARERASELEAFTYAVSQGLQAPMRHVRAFTQVLADDHAASVDQHMRLAIDRIVGATERMEKMLDGLVALSRTSRFSVNRKPVDMAALARDLVDECQMTDRRGIFDCPDTLEAVGDERLIRQALRNLMENAFKFSSTHRTPRVELGVLSGTPAVYFVRDNGIGFDDTAAEHLFDLFHRLSPSDEYPGTGVGLSIAQRVVHKHGGRIWARSRPGMGATFYFTLGL